MFYGHNVKCNTNKLFILLLNLCNNFVIKIRGGYMVNYKTTDDGFGIHTFMLTAPLNYEKYRKLKLILQKSVWEKKESQNQSYIKSKSFMTKGYFGISSKLYMQNGFA